MDYPKILRRITRARVEIDEAYQELVNAEDVTHKATKEAKDIRARLDALESKVTAIEEGGGDDAGTNGAD